MPRLKKNVSIQHKHGNGAETSSSSSCSESVSSKSTFSKFSNWKTIIGFGCLVVAVYIGALGYLETRVNTPFDDDKVVKDTGLAVPERFWGTYRPQVYFGLKARDPQSPVFGMMWYELASANHKGVRHWCDQNDNLPKYGWTRHDGFTFGEQYISDPPHEIVTSFVKSHVESHGGQWTARINVTTQSSPPPPFVLIWYVALDGGAGRVWADGERVRGYANNLSQFSLRIVPVEGKILHRSYSEAHAPGIHLLKEKLYSLLRVEKHPVFGKLAVLGPDEEVNGMNKDINFIPIQLVAQAPFSVDIVYTSDDLPTPALKGREYTKVLEEKKRNFDEEFEEKFRLREKGYSAGELATARDSTSNMVGGIGYWFGSSRVQSHRTSEPVPYWKAALYSAVPSRSFFPRGFLWDEGFHGLVLGRWSPRIQLDIAAHWLDLLNVEGWIPREQILGPEALARVPKEFVVQNNNVANPPILLIQIAHFVRIQPELYLPGTPLRDTLERMYTRLQGWYSWFSSSQRGELPTSWRWRGRDPAGEQLNPNTLASGLDDYPRASHPSDMERHVDLRCWMFAAASAMATVANLLHRDASKYEATRDQLGDEDLLNKLHWSPDTQTYADYGLHTDGVKLVRTRPAAPGEQARVVRTVTSPPAPQLVTSAFGYVSLFPMLMKVLKPDSPKLGIMLSTLDKPELLWSPYGLRSLSKSAPLFMKRNTEHDPPYWRGQVWININYLALASLRHYSDTPGPYANVAARLYAELKKNVVSNIVREYNRTGYLWEQYSSEDGSGSGCRPFTGWTGLVTLIMADLY